jgi:hypothetical protein
MRPVLRVGAGAALLLPLLAALPLPGAFTGVAVLVGLVVLVDLCELLATAAARPVLLAAVVPVVAVPVAASSGSGWAGVPAVFAVTFVLSILLALAGGRRARVAELLGGTLLAALLAGLGAGGLVALRALPAGAAAWVALVVALSAAADLGAPLARAAVRAQPEPPEVLLALGGPALAVTVVAGVALLVAPAALPAGSVAAAALVALLASRVGGSVALLLAAEAGTDPARSSLRPGSGVLLTAGVTLLLTAPAVAVLARALA